ncbi:hypothetical protein G8V06_09215 [Clostridium botulinum D/C]|nr:hypothetical protein [Clostridium botulinum]MCD3234271.1 hypothetical protein [Clostridium botulinum D/C]MCD3240329.1 hypothetical protein [Clostridium botulinum D/C]MCD3267690.1 hypothetical protein [Clostridium botulinum D/C]MCD3306161.1 hypothetical protein [Clostridium botulinum D/C]MCD3314871.1 hypothetical protein [Clostridium botulinum D/C]
MPSFNLSFKKTTKDMKLYMKVMEKEEKSEFIKECIDFYIKNNENKKVEK